MMMMELRIVPLLLLIAALFLSSFGVAAYDKTSCVPRPHETENNYPDPDPEAPERFFVTILTTASDEPFKMEVVRSWSPLGVDRFYALILDHYYDCSTFFRVVPSRSLYTSNEESNSAD